MRVIFLITGILICALLIVGCVQTNSPAEKKTPSVIVTSQTTPGVPNINRLPAAHPDTTPRYRDGDSIDFSLDIDKSPHLIILNYNNRTGHYVYAEFFRMKT